MDNKTNNIISEFKKDIIEILGASLNQIILYGSYARDDNSTESDIDIMILVDIDDDEIRKVRRVISDCAFELILKYGVDISPIITNVNHFKYWEDTLPFYRNIKNEGVVLNISFP